MDQKQIKKKREEYKLGVEHRWLVGYSCHDKEKSKIAYYLKKLGDNRSKYD